jgi:ribonuclease inhibitor
MPIKQYVLNGFKIHSLDDLYIRLEKQLSLPASFGRNLDALWDVLSADVEGPFKIIWKHGDASKQFMGKDFDKVVKLLKELEADRSDFKMKIEP